MMYTSKKKHTHTWWLTLADIVDLPQPCVSVAGQIVPDHLTFGQQGDEDGDWDDGDQEAHQEHPVAWRRFRVHCGGYNSPKISILKPTLIVIKDLYF